MCKHAQPRQNSYEQDGNEIVPWASAMMNLAGEALQMFMNEKEVRELRIFQRYQYKPRRRDREEKQQSGDQMQPLPYCPVEREQCVESQASARQDAADQPLGQYRQRHAGPAGKHPVSSFIGARIVALRQR